MFHLMVTANLLQNVLCAATLGRDVCSDFGLGRHVAAEKSGHVKRTWIRRSYSELLPLPNLKQAKKQAMASTTDWSNELVMASQTWFVGIPRGAI